jgi:hypothetical protein
MELLKAHKNPTNTDCHKTRNYDLGAPGQEPCSGPHNFNTVQNLERE